MKKKFGENIGMLSFSSEENYSQLVDYASSLVAPGGFLITFCNTHSITKQEYVLIFNYMM
jgi:23S rRNA G2069 N7-methylase RlmK/C1962 C5-methylase RlmI